MTEVQARFKAAVKRNKKLARQRFVRNAAPILLSTMDSTGIDSCHSAVTEAERLAKVLQERGYL